MIQAVPEIILNIFSFLLRPCRSVSVICSFVLSCLNNGDCQGLGKENCCFSKNCGGFIWQGSEFADSSNKVLSQVFLWYFWTRLKMCARWFSWVDSNWSNFHMTFYLVAEQSYCVNRLLIVSLLWYKFRACFLLQHEKVSSNSLILSFVLTCSSISRKA